MLQCLIFISCFVPYKSVESDNEKMIRLWCANLVGFGRNGVQPAACSHPISIRPIPSLVANRTHIKILQNHRVFSSHWPRTADQIAPANNSIMFGNLTLNKMWGKKLDQFHTRLRKFLILVLKSDIPLCFLIIKGLKTVETTLFIVFIATCFEPKEPIYKK